MTYYTVQEIRSALVPIIEANGYTSNEARLILDDFIESDLLGKSDYGLINLPRLLAYDAARLKTSISTSTNGNVTMINGGGRFAQTLLPQISQILSEGTSRTGLHAMGITNVTTVTRGGTLTYPLCREGIIAMAFLFTNIAISRIPAMGRSRLGVNVISIGIPTEPSAVLYDASLTAMPLRKIRRLTESGSKPPDYPIGIDSTNQETSRAAEIVDLIPIAGVRGFGLSLATQLIAGAMLGLIDPAEPDAYTGNNSIMLLTIDPNRFGGQWKARRRDVHVWLDGLVEESANDFRIPGQKYSELVAMKETASIDIPAQLETMLNRSTLCGD